MDWEDLNKVVEFCKEHQILKFEYKDINIEFSDKAFFDKIEDKEVAEKEQKKKQEERKDANRSPFRNCLGK